MRSICGTFFGIAFLAVAVLAVGSREESSSTTPSYCQRNESCWPTVEEVTAFYNQLDPDHNRSLYWTAGEPRTCAVPLQSPGEQPLYGFGGSGLQPLYGRTEMDENHTCFATLPDGKPYISDVCLAGIRNSPYNGWIPAFVVWALSAKHVSLAIQFATNHSLCVMVAGPGHDFLNRHSCSDGVFIRTTLMKNVEWLPSVGEAGAFRFGPGIVFSEAHFEAAKRQRVVSSGWASTVGVVGWAIGGGHGPFAPRFGLGVDNIVELELVGPRGEVLTVNRSRHADLYWALRGGGGSTWGVVTSITYRAHRIPAAGFSRWDSLWSGSLCDANGIAAYKQMIDNYTTWIQDRDARWGGLAFFWPQTTNLTSCGLGWIVEFRYVFQGSQNETAFIEGKRNLTSLNATEFAILHYSTWWDEMKNQPLEPIAATPLYSPGGYAGGVPSVLLPRRVVEDGRLATALKARLDDCLTTYKCGRQELYQDITGNRGSPNNDSASVSINPDLRSGLLHWIAAGGYNQTAMEKLYYTLGNHSYFSESAYEMDDWEARYWGPNYSRLHQIKQQWDPQNIFQCYHCVHS
jgi:ribonuclease T2